MNNQKALLMISLTPNHDWFINFLQNCNNTQNCCPILTCVEIQVILDSLLDLCFFLFVFFKKKRIRLFFINVKKNLSTNILNIVCSV